MDMLHPMLAGLAMVLSSLSVVGAALSLHRVKLD
jgi:cation transport ATPase